LAVDLTDQHRPFVDMDVGCPAWAVRDILDRRCRRRAEVHHGIDEITKVDQAFLDNATAE
jgi:hypothetical protein